MDGRRDLRRRGPAGRRALGPPRAPPPLALLVGGRRRWLAGQLCWDLYVVTESVLTLRLADVSFWTVAVLVIAGLWPIGLLIYPARSAAS